MTIKYLSCQWLIGGIRRLNTKTGHSRRCFKFKWLETPDKGSAWRQGLKWFYWYEEDGLLHLQHKKNIWKVDGSHQFHIRQVSKRYREFKVMNLNNEVFRFKYKVKGYWISQFDPTYDSIDAENDDFFLNFINCICKPDVKSTNF